MSEVWDIFFRVFGVRSHARVLAGEIISSARVVAGEYILRQVYYRLHTLKDDGYSRREHRGES